METLALIAYRQPITRGEIEEVRGVSVSSNIIKTLHERDWIRVVGHRDVPGRPALYATSKVFLDYFSLKSLNDLPTLAEIRDLDSINQELELPDPDKQESDNAEVTESVNDEVEQQEDIQASQDEAVDIAPVEVAEEKSGEDQAETVETETTDEQIEATETSSEDEQQKQKDSPESIG